MKNESTINLKKLKFQIKVKEVTDKVKSGANKVITFAKENPQVAIAALGAAVGIAKTGQKVITTHADEVNRERRIYDPRKGRYSEMRRKPTNKEWNEIDRRYENGENYRAILDDMRLLKN